MNDKLKIRPYCLDCLIAWKHLPELCEECPKLMDSQTEEALLVSKYGEAIQDLKTVIDEYKILIE